jgi:subtilisin family serine protease
MPFDPYMGLCLSLSYKHTLSLCVHFQVAMRVLDCSGSGTYTGIIRAINEVVQLCAKRKCVANMSLGGGASTSLNAAVAGAVDQGIVFVVAAGNENTDACTSSPASTPTAITVGATTSADARAGYSNYGTCKSVNPAIAWPVLHHQ